MVALGEQGGLCEDRVRERPLQYEPPAICAVTDELRFPVNDEMQHRDLLTPAEEERTGLELPFGGVEAVKSIEKGHDVTAIMFRRSCRGTMH